MSSKRVRLITLTGIILIALVIGISALMNVLTKDTKEISLPEVSVSGSAAPSPDNTVGDGLDRVSVTKDNVQAIIATIKRPAAYTRTVTVQAGGEDAIYQINVAVATGGTALRVSRAGIKENIIITENKLYIWYDGDKTPYERPVDSLEDEKKSSDEYQMMMSYEDVLNLDKNSITAADYVEYEGESCIYVQFISPLLQYDTECYISLDTGILIAAEQYDGNTLIYKMTTSGYDGAEPDMSAFSLPDGSNALSAP